MAIDYMLQLPCEVRRTIPEAQLITMVKHLGIAEFAIAKFKEVYPHYDMDTIVNQCTVEIGAIGPDGKRTQMPVTIAKILSALGPLEGVKGHCKACRANVADRSFGCIGKINYPIPREAEEWLLSRLPDDVKSPSLSRLPIFDLISL